MYVVEEHVSFKNIRIHLQTWPRRVAEANAGTQEQGRKFALACTSGNYDGIYMSFKNVFICHNDLKRHVYVKLFLSDYLTTANF